MGLLLIHLQLVCLAGLDHDRIAINSSGCDRVVGQELQPLASPAAKVEGG